MIIRTVNYADLHEKFHVIKTLPKGNILLFAGDTSAVHPSDWPGQIENLKTHLWELLEYSDRWEHIVLGFGNHEPAFDYSKYSPEEARKIYDMVWDLEKEFNEKTKKARLYMSPGMTTHSLKGTDIKVMSSPYSKPFGSAMWGFWWTDEKVETYKTDNRIAKNFKNIDIVVSHESIKGYGDTTVTGESSGTTNITDIMTTHGSKPQLFVTGHIHEGYGIYEGKDDWKGSTFINASVLNEDYENVNEPVVFDIEVEDGRYPKGWTEEEN